MIELWGKQGADVLNRPLFEGFPEAKNQGFEELLDHVFSTGDTFTAQSIPVDIPRNGKKATVYINFVYEAYKAAKGVISGIMVVATEVTDQVFAAEN